MLSAPTPADEPERLRALRRYCVLDTPAEPAFDRLSQILAHVLAVPTALVSLVDSERQWFKSRHGLDAAQTPRDVSFCGHAVYSRRPLVVPDTWLDPRFADNPLVRGELGLRFYAGVPLMTADGQAIGTLCAIDYLPRPAPSAEQLTIMTLLADAVVAALEQRLYGQTQAARARLARCNCEAAPAAAALAERTPDDLGACVYGTKR